MTHHDAITARRISLGAVALLERPQTGDLQLRVRDAHRSFPTGVTVVAALAGGKPVGLAVNAFSSVSMEPPLVLVCVNSGSQSHAALWASRHLGISILGHDQKSVATAFAKSGGDKFRDVDWHAGACGVPMLDGASASFEVRVEERIVAGTHTIFLAQVIGVEATEKAPLLYSAGGFFDGARLTEAS